MYNNPYGYLYPSYNTSQQNPMTAQALPTSTNSTDIFSVSIQDDRIIMRTPDGPKNVGITWEAYQKLDSITSEYYEILKANDLLPKEINPSEEANKELLDVIKAFKEELKETKEEREQLRSSLDSTLKLVDSLTGGKEDESI